jgi:hypothetical protein
VYKQINAPVGQLGLASLKVSTRALESGNTSNDVFYSVLENQLIRITNSRNQIATQMSALLENAAFDNTPINQVSATKLIFEGKALLIEVDALQA